MTVTKTVVSYGILFSGHIASGCSFHNLHFSYRIGISTASKIVRAVCLSIWSLMRPQCISKPTKRAVGIDYFGV